MFTKNDLKNGDLIKLANGTVCIYINTFEIFLTENDGFMPLYKYNEDLTLNHKDVLGYSVEMVRRPSNGMECRFRAFEWNKGIIMFDRSKERREMTVEEIEKDFGIKVKFIKGN